MNLSNIKCLIFDVDGVLTDGSLFYSTDGEVLKRFNVKDGFGLTMAKDAGFILCIITARNSEVVRKRAQDLKFNECYIGQRNKKEALDEICQKYDLNINEIAYMGDDIIDLKVLTIVGFSSCPADAVSIVKDSVHFVSAKEGGHGAVRDVIEHILKSQNRYDEITKSYL